MLPPPSTLEAESLCLLASEESLVSVNAEAAEDLLSCPSLFKPGTVPLACALLLSLLLFHATLVCPPLLDITLDEEDAAKVCSNCSRMCEREAELNDDVANCFTSVWCTSPNCFTSV
jgi:hypothetical protein